MGTIPKIGADGKFTGRAKVALDAEYAKNTALTAEATARATADTANANAIAAEATARGTGDLANAAAISNEVTARTTGDNALDARLDVLEGFTSGSGYLTQSQLDLRYVNELPAGHMVTIGSSNAVSATLWPAGVATDLGLTNHNYAIGGGAFTSSGAGRFESQLDTAIADTNYDKSLVRVVLIADNSNDVRYITDISDEADTLFFKARSNYPNARIIVLPTIWNLSSLNAGTPNHQASILRRYSEMTLPAAKYDVELINYSWTWHFDSVGWVESGGSGAHLSADGYTLTRNMVTRFIKRGGDTDRPLGWKFGAAASGISGDYMYLRTSRTGNTGRIQASFLADDKGLDIPIAQMQDGANPMDAEYFPCWQNTNRNVVGTLVLFPSGLLRTWGVLDGSGGETWHVNHSYPVF